MKGHKNTTLLWNNGGKERQEEYPISAVCAANVGTTSCLPFPALFCG